MTRRSLFYIINLIFPCLLIYAVSFLGFFLPVESGEKVNLEITILLALVVFLLIVGETLPPTPDAIPVLGQLLISDSMPIFTDVTLLSILHRSYRVTHEMQSIYTVSQTRSSATAEKQRISCPRQGEGD